MKEINKPNVKTYYFIIDSDGKVIQEGFVNPNQVLSTGEENTIIYGTDRLTIINKLEPLVGNQVAFNDVLTDSSGSDVLTWGDGNREDTFFVFAAPSVAEPLSRALYEVVNPGQEGLYARVYEHEDEDQYSILEFRETDIIPIALGANQTPLADALAITVEDGALTQEEVDGIVSAISTYAGQEVNLVDFIPASWADKQVNKREAIELGYDIP